MSSNSPINSDNQEIDLTQIAQNVNGIFESLLNRVFRFILFIKRNIVVLTALFIVGAVIGFYLDKKIKSYNNQIIVSPNFGSTDYLYAKVNLIQSKINEGDTLFLKEIVLKINPKLKNLFILPVGFKEEYLKSYLNSPKNEQLFQVIFIGRFIELKGPLQAVKIVERTKRPIIRIEKLIKLVKLILSAKYNKTNKTDKPTRVIFK